MNRLCIIVILALASLVDASAQSSNAPRIKFDKTSCDFGTFSKTDGTKSCVFKFKNKGTAKLVITKVHAFCDCISYTYPQDFIAPGDSGQIAVTYTSDHVGAFNKNLQVYTNCSESMIRLYLRGMIVEPDEVKNGNKGDFYKKK